MENKKINLNIVCLYRLKCYPCTSYLIHLSIWLILFSLGSTMTLNGLFKLTTNMTVIWVNCDIPSQLNTKSFLIGLSTHKNMLQLTSGFCDNPRAVSPFFLVANTQVKSGEV